MGNKTLYIKFVNGDVCVFTDDWSTARVKNGLFEVLQNDEVVFAAPAVNVNYYRLTDGI